MGRLKTIARRSFLIGSAAIVGGVAFGAYLVKRDPENPLSLDAAAGDGVFNPWVKINADGITLIAPHADSGQGAASMQALPFMDAALAARLPFIALLALALGATWYAVYHLARSPQAQPVAFAFGGKSSINGGQSPGGNRVVSRYVPAIERARADLNLNVHISLHDALLRTGRWHQKH